MIPRSSRSLADGWASGLGLPPSLPLKLAIEWLFSGRPSTQESSDVTATNSPNGVLFRVLSASPIAEAGWEGAKLSLPSLVLLLRERRLLDLLTWRRPTLACAASISACREDGVRTHGTDPDFTNTLPCAAANGGDLGAAVVSSDTEARVSASEIAAASTEGLGDRLMTCPV